MPLIKKHSILATAIAAISVAFSAQAQYRLPDTHNTQHQDLLASQKAITTDIKIANTLKYLSEIQEREDMMDSEIFTEFWEIDAVNPYGSKIEIPNTKDIDVSEYVAPVPGKVNSNYGYRRRFRKMHRGIDLHLRVGDTVRAAFTGKVRLTKFQRKGYGYYVVIRHENGLETVYGHLSKFLVKPNQTVKAGDPIALGGNTGKSTGPHLHFETRYLGLAINPAAIIDFENRVPHKDIFTFDKSTYEKSQKYGPTKKRTTARKRKSTKKSTTTAKK